jgi:2-polyprenyl-3-methyl-5-hydroxy-6-metoxy-1,4-benzoquinol methylase
MASNDAKRWNKRYLSKDPEYQPHPQDFLLKHADLLPSEGLALDLPMGLGGSAGFLASQGLDVVGIDISEVGVRRAKVHFPNLQACVTDLEHLWLPDRHFDLIISFYYLDRGIWPSIEPALKPGGLFYFETFQKSQAADSHMNPAFLLEPGELEAGFPGLKTIIYEEKSAPGKGGILQTVAGLVVQKPD